MDGITDEMGMSLSRFWEVVMDREFWHAAVHGVQKELDMTEQLDGLTELMVVKLVCLWEDEGCNFLFHHLALCEDQSKNYYYS